MTKVLTGRMGQIRLVIVSGFSPHLLDKQFTDFLFLDMNGRHDDMTRPLMHQLKNTLTQITFHNLNALFLQIFIQPALLCQHGFAFDEMLDVVSFQNMVDNRTILIGIFRPINMGAIGDSILFELLKQQVQVTVTVLLDGTGHVTELLPLWYFFTDFISFGTHHPQGLVMPGCQFPVFLEFLGCNGMFCTHNPEAKISTIWIVLIGR